MTSGVALITGAGRGIGRAIACTLAQTGVAMAICARTQCQLDESASAIRAAAARPIELLAHRCDISSPEEVAQLAKQVREQLGVVRILINNAGIVARGRLDEQPIESWRQVVDVNLFGTYLVTRAFLPPMRAAKAGRIINIASISGRQGTAQLTAYCAAKHGLVGMTRALAEELRDEGIQVNAVCPGSVDTEMLVGTSFSPAMNAEDVAQVVRFLAIEAPDAMTGACLDVFG